MITVWEPFTISADLALTHPSYNFLPGKVFAARKIPDLFDINEDLLRKDLLPESNMPKGNIAKSTFSKIRIRVSQVNSFMMPDNEDYSSGKDKNASRMAGVLSSFLHNPSQEKVFETLKFIEPSVNLGVEF